MIKNSEKEKKVSNRTSSLWHRTKKGGIWAVRAVVKCLSTGSTAECSLAVVGKAFREEAVEAGDTVTGIGTCSC